MGNHKINLNQKLNLKITCLIIDDEPLARNRLYKLIESFGEVEVLGQCKTGKEAITRINKLSPDFVFLDIQMKDMDGFDVLKNLTSEKKPLVIFVTAFDEYALKAFDFFAFDYLLKPFKRERFNQSVERVLHHIESHNQPIFEDKINHLLDYITNSKSEKSISKIPIKTGNIVSFIDVPTIKYILASGSYIDIYTNEKVFVHRSSLQDLLSAIESKQLIRIHRSSIINIDFIDKVIHSNFGEIDVKMKDEKLLRISKSYRKNFQKILGI